MANHPYFYLNQLLGAYFHQDAYIDGESDESILSTYIESSWPYQRLGVRADILRFLHNHPTGIREAFEKTFVPDVSVGEEDEGVRRWLTKLEETLSCVC